MSFWGIDTELGTFALAEVFEVYDRPVLATVRTKAGQAFLAVLVSIEPPSESWLLVAVSESRLESIRTGAIDLRDSFVLSEEGRAFLLELAADSVKTTRLLPTEIDDDFLPLPGQKIEAQATVLARKLEAPQVQAKKKNRTSLRLTFDFLGARPAEAPAKALGLALASLQDAIHELAPLRSQEGVSLPRTFSDLMVTDVGLGSFEVEIASAQFVGLFGASPVREAALEFSKLLKAAKEGSSALKEELTDLTPKAAGKFLAFLRSMEGAVESATFSWASPKDPTSDETKIHDAEIRNAIRLFEESDIQQPTTHSVDGVLQGASIPKKTFEFWAEAAPGEKKARRKFAGKVAPEAMPTLRGAALGDRFIAVIEEVEALKPMTGVIETSFTLKSLSAK